MRDALMTERSGPACIILRRVKSGRLVKSPFRPSHKPPRFGVPEEIRTPDPTLRSTFYTFFANAVWSLTTLQTRINTDFFSEHNVFSSLLFLLILRDDSNSN